MRYVILRDDDTNALTPVECLERLYRPFLDRGLPVNLAVIPNVATGTTLPDGRPEGFLLAKNGTNDPAVPIGTNARLVRYLRDNPGYEIAQHGCRHDYFEFERIPAGEVSERLEQGTRLLMDAGFAKPQTFIAPYDKLSRVSLGAVARKFDVISTGWFELQRLPVLWWPKYLAKKIRQAPHWQVGRTRLLSHPGCLLSCHRNYDSMLETVIEAVNSRRLTILVTHWWEYFRDQRTDEPFIGFLHETARYLAGNPDIKVISFSDLVRGELHVN
jgi:predicted deacetylase